VCMNLFENLIYDPKKFFSLNLAVFFVVPVLLVSATGWRSSSALTINSARDCDDNAVLRCGALNFDELETRYQNAGVADIYSSFGISASDISSARNSAVEGVVTNNDNIWIYRSSGLCPASEPTSQLERNNPNLCLVATNAMTAGRQNMTGSTVVTSGGVTFYRRPPSVSFRSNSLPAFVVMNNNRFNFAIIASCGNPVTAAPVVAKTLPAPAPKPTPAPTPQPTPSPAPPSTTNITNNNTNNNSNVNNNNIVLQPIPTTVAIVAPPVQTPVQTPPAATQTGTTTPQPAQPVEQSTQPVGKTLPNTGPGPIFAISGISSLLATTGHLVLRRRIG